MISKFTSVSRILAVAAIMIFAVQTAKAQVVKTENFDNNFTGTAWPNTELPFGWVSGKIAPSTDANNYWDRVNVGVLPACAPRGGSPGMVRFRSAYIMTGGEQGYLVSRPYDLTARPGASTVSFWVYREATAGNDNIQVYANNNPDPTIGPGTLLQDAVTAFFNIPRPCGTAPVDPCGVWSQHTFQIPAGAAFNTSTLYIIIKVTDNGAAGANVYIDDFSIQTYPSAQTFVSVGLDFQNLANVAGPPVNGPNNWIIGCRVTVNRELTQCPMGAFTFTHNGSTNPGNDIANSGTGGVKLWWTGGTNSFSLTNALLVGSYAGPAFPVPNYSITPIAANFAAYGGGLLNGNNYFWITYDISGTATANDYVDADFISATINTCPTTVTNMCGGVGCALNGARLIDVAYCTPSYVAGTSWLNGSFTNNDYVKRVICAGDPSYPPGIDNDHTECPVGSFPPGAGLGAPADPCITSPTMLQLGTNTPFSPHPPDYTKIPSASVPNMCGPGNSSRTAVFLANGGTSYQISIQVGTWYGANCVAAWIDFNHNGVFSNTMVPAAGGEKICQSGYMNALTWLGPVSFLVPNGATTGYFGQTTLRVREWYANPSMDACGNGYYGEVEDYTVTLRPDCSPLYPGWKIWLGYTDDWNVNSNWCGGVPTINDNALIPGKGAQAFNRGNGTYHPVIKTVAGVGYNATTRKLIILNDTVEVNSPIAGSLRVSDSLSIGVSTAVNTSALIVDSSYNANAVLSNGVNVNTTWLPFRQSFREQKVQLMYKTNELLAQGMIQGDVFDAIVVPIRVRRSTQPYTVSINMYYATNNATYPAFTNVGYTMPVPVAPADCRAPQASAPVNVFNGVINFSSIPANGSGNYTITLNGAPFTFTNNPATPLIVEICYSAAAASLNDDTWQTQTVGYRSILMLSNLGAYVPAACLWTNTAPNGTNLTFRQASDFRPNLTFMFHRVFQKFPIQLETNGATTANWANYGDFVPANSIVTFMGSSAQNIAGPNPTTFDELKINHSGVGSTRQMTAATVNDTLWMQNGRLYLNQLTLTIKNGDKGAITRLAPNTGYLYSEDLPPNYGRVNWQMGANTGAHLFPFANAANQYIPFTYTPTAGTTDLTIATYYPSTTPLSLLPWPTGVTTLNQYYNPTVTDAPNLVKRFWPMTNTGTGSVADLIFGWAGIEQPTSGTGTYVAQRWDNTGAPIPGYLSVGPGWWPSIVPGANANLVPANGVNNFNVAWVLSLLPNPLPISSLLNFTAKPEKDKVRLDWTTASETNTDKFIVERTTNTSDFNFIDRLQSKGPSTSTLNYSTYDYNPVVGMQFYRLTQIDLNGGDTYSKLIPVNFGKEVRFEIVTTVNNDDGSFD
ncbi:MAG TPA: GEVED domain-containing protein, partial [Bacteroidia bacterium]|nr:GEVED domain-containing protein [Bacteroidia bacterium]